MMIIRKSDDDNRKSDDVNPKSDDVNPKSDDGNPDTFPLILSRLDAFHQSGEPDAGVHHHALHLVLAHQDAALGIVGIVAGMDTDTLETRSGCAT